MGYFDDIWNRATGAFDDAQEEADRIYDEAVDGTTNAARAVADAPGDAYRAADEWVTGQVRSGAALAGDAVGDFADRAIPRDLVDDALQAQRQAGETVKWYVIGFIALIIAAILGAIVYFAGPFVISGLSRWETVV